MSMDFRKIGAARLVLCTATEAGAGIVSGSIAYLVSPTMSGQVVVDRQGDLPEVSGDVPDADAMLDALDSAVRSYVDWSVRFRYLGRRACLLGETGNMLVPSREYRVVLWTGRGPDGYSFSFLPLRAAGRVSPSEVPADAHTVRVADGAEG